MNDFSVCKSRRRLKVHMFLQVNSKFWVAVYLICSSLCTRFYGLFYVKNKVSAKTSLIFIFYCGTVSSETGEKMSELFSDFLASKNETGWWFHVWNWHKIMKPSRIRSGKKMKLTARGYAAAVSFIFFLTESGRFHNFSQFHTWNHSQFHFLSQKAEKIQTFFASFTWNWPQKKSEVSS